MLSKIFLSLTLTMGLSYWILSTMWLNHPTCKDMIQQAWRLHTNGSRAAQLINKLSNVRKKATNWNRPGFGKVYNEIKRKLAHLQDIQNTITSLEDVRKKKLIREDLEVLLYREEIMWTQKARSNWILYGDRNIKYFQIMIR